MPVVLSGVAHSLANGQTESKDPYDLKRSRSDISLRVREGIPGS